MSDTNTTPNTTNAPATARTYFVAEDELLKAAISIATDTNGNAAWTDDAYRFRTIRLLCKTATTLREMSDAVSAREDAIEESREKRAEDRRYAAMAVSSRRSTTRDDSNAS